jgi:hypothetical protein
MIAMLSSFFMGYPSFHRPSGGSLFRIGQRFSSLTSLLTQLQREVAVILKKIFEIHFLTDTKVTGPAKRS